MLGYEHRVGKKKKRRVLFVNIRKNRAMYWYCVCVGLVLSGCGSHNPTYVEKPVKVLYATAMKLLAEKSYEKAADTFDELDRQHPYSDCAIKAQLFSGFCAFKAEKFARAILTLDVFIDLHPGSEFIAYAYYLRALSYYTDMLGLTKDKETAQLALEAFKEILRRFPKTEYAHDARIKQEFICEHLASHDMLVAKQHLLDKRYVAAWVRFSALIADWPRSVLMPEVLYRMIECHVALGMVGSCDKTYAMLKHNFPKNVWTHRARQLMAPAQVVAGKSFQKVVPPSSGKLAHTAGSK